MSRDNREVYRVLKNKFAFEDSPNRSRDHRWVELKLPGMPPIVTFFSHGRQSISDILWSKIARQLRVRAAYLAGMVECTNSREAYYTQVRTDPVPPWDNLLRGATTATTPRAAKKGSRKRGRRR